MESVAVKERGKRVEIRRRVLLTVIGMVLLYVLIRNYVKNITTRYDEEFSFAAMLILVGSVYAGRSLSQLFMSANKTMLNWVLILLPLLMTGCAFTAVLFASSLLSHQNLMYGLFCGLPLVILCLTSGIFIKLIRKEISRRIHEAEITAAHSQTELILLQSQLSPHFLFNTLNNIYGIAITEHEKVPQLLLKLSELLRYSVYETKEQFVPLRDELAYINNYIDFEEIRIGDRLNLITNMESVTTEHPRIAPMLLIVFIENAFKHSKNTHDQKIFIEIAVRIWGDNILFSAKNSYGAGVAEKYTSGNSRGLGLLNVRKRLELLYPGDHDLKIEDAPTCYNVMLRLKIQ